MITWKRWSPFMFLPPVNSWGLCNMPLLVFCDSPRVFLLITPRRVIYCTRRNAARSDPWVIFYPNSFHSSGTNKVTLLIASPHGDIFFLKGKITKRTTSGCFIYSHTWNENKKVCCEQRKDKSTDRGRANRANVPFCVTISHVLPMNSFFLLLDGETGDEFLLTMVNIMAISIVKVQQKCNIDISVGSNIHGKKNYTSGRGHQNECECLTSNLALIQNKLYSRMVVVKCESSLEFMMVLPATTFIPCCSSST